MRVVRPKPSPAVLLLFPAGASEVSRFSCMKLPGVSGVYDYAGPDRNSRYRSRPCCLPPMQKRQRPDCQFSKLNTQPTCTPVYASPNTSRCATQNSGPSGSLLLSRRTLSFPASCRFIPAHCIGDNALFEICARRASISKYRSLQSSSPGSRFPPTNVYCGMPISFGSCSRMFCLDSICSSLRRAS